MAVAWRRPDGAAHVMLAEQREGVEWVVDRCAGMQRTWGRRLVVEQTGTAGFLLPHLKQAGVKLKTVSRRFYADACLALDAAVSARAVQHGNAPGLNAAVGVARWSSWGDAGQRVLSRKDPRMSGVVADALALHGLTVQPRNVGGWIVGL